LKGKKQDQREKQPNLPSPQKKKKEREANFPLICDEKTEAKKGEG